MESSRIDSESWLDGRSSEISEREREETKEGGEKDRERGTGRITNGRFTASIIHRRKI